MPRVGLSQPPSMTPPEAGSTCDYLSLFALGIRLSHLPGRPRGEPFGRGIVEMFAST
jgi:hypothetical protein